MKTHQGDSTGRPRFASQKKGKRDLCFIGFTLTLASLVKPSPVIVNGFDQQQDLRCWQQSCLLTDSFDLFKVNVCYPLVILLTALIRKVVTMTAAEILLTRRKIQLPNTLSTLNAVDTQRTHKPPSDTAKAWVCRNHRVDRLNAFTGCRVSQPQ